MNNELMEKKPKYIHHTDVHNLIAPRQVVPLLIKLFHPKNVLDVGCGIGTWLSVFKQHGVRGVHGIDGDFVDKKLLWNYINEEEFTAKDLTLSFDLKKKFDLVICLEVAEHLEKKQANGFIKSICKHADVIVFSAAVPGQGGQNHLNEQWPAYWINLFKIQGFKSYDILRPLIWNITEIDWWYKQNMLVFSNKSLTGFNESALILPLVHPQHLQQKVSENHQQDARIRELEMTCNPSRFNSIGIKSAWKIFIKSVKNKFNKIVSI
ncbi:MAG: methyltransferase domain-containing protein [Bacteroidia bacterium]|nr:methyltransferase domain-containing protein [Bacteroidia bacterium]